jgi:hypothetical protein
MAMRRLALLGRVAGKGEKDAHSDTDIPGRPWFGR